MINCRDYSSILPLTPRELHSIMGRIQQDPNGCWLWDGTRDAEGYGRIHLRGRIWLVHRLLYVIFVGPIKPGDVVDHLCGVKACCNPKHLEAVTPAINRQRAGGPRQHKMPACRNGHPMKGVNVGWTVRRGKRVRYCKACRSARNHRNWVKRRAVALASAPALPLPAPAQTPDRIHTQTPVLTTQTPPLIPVDPRRGLLLNWILADGTRVLAAAI